MSDEQAKNAWVNWFIVSLRYIHHPTKWTICVRHMDALKRMWSTT
jgi:hypothetical protein